MNLGFIRIEKEGYSLLGGVLFIVLLSAFLRPRQIDNAHTIGILTAKGGKAIHEGQLYLGDDLLGNFTVILTAQVVPPVKGDIVVRLTGPENLVYTVTSRNPPALPITNRAHAWYRFNGQTLSGVRPGDDLILYLKIKAPTQPGSYEVTLSDLHDPARIYLHMPVTFSSPDAKSAGAVDPLNAWPCH